MNLPVDLGAKQIMGFDYRHGAFVLSHRTGDGRVVFAALEGDDLCELFHDRPYSNSILLVGDDDFLYGARWELKRYRAGVTEVVADGFKHISSIRNSYTEGAFVVTDSDDETVSLVWLDGRRKILVTTKDQLLSDPVIKTQLVADVLWCLTPDGVLFQHDLESGVATRLLGGHQPGIWDALLAGHKFRSVRAFAFDSDSGDLYIGSNHAVFRLNPARGGLELFAGDEMQHGGADGHRTTARFAVIRDLKLHAGQLFVADAWNDKVRAIGLTTGEVTTVLGSGRNEVQAGTVQCAPPRSFHLNRPLAIEIFHDHLIVANSHSHYLVAVPLDGNGPARIFSGTPTPSKDQYGGDFADGPASEARFNGPRFLAASPLGLLVADTWNSSIRVVSSAGDVSTLFKCRQHARIINTVAYWAESVIFSSVDSTVKMLPLLRSPTLEPLATATP